ncbi:hypothetical protein Fcan01_27339 [Folsomia candida]|uniref:Uncharacterized protein n=1 Tax=Folsomia candida TaxID=158441 RepID=A0A226CY27_FOLCA|nr:hypothetical protein Fcan01_27339 [Folsomia candida]
MWSWAISQASHTLVSKNIRKFDILSVRLVQSITLASCCFIFSVSCRFSKLLGTGWLRRPRIRFVSNVGQDAGNFIGAVVVDSINSVGSAGRAAGTWVSGAAEDSLNFVGRVGQGYGNLVGRSVAQSIDWVADAAIFVGDTVSNNWTLLGQDMENFVDWLNGVAYSVEEIVSDGIGFMITSL